MTRQKATGPADTPVDTGNGTSPGGTEPRDAAPGATASALVEALVGEPRLRRVAAFTGDTVLLGADLPDASGSLTPLLVCYRRQDDGRWQAIWSRPGAGPVLGLADGFLLAEGDGLAFQLTAGGAPRPVDGVRGSVAALAPRPGGSHVACLLRILDSTPILADGPLAGSDAVLLRGADAGLEQVRRPGTWRVRLIDAAVGGPARDVPVPLPPGTSLAGEAAFAGPDTLLLGLAHHRADGSRRFGLLVVDPEHARPARQLLFDGVDLCYPAPGTGRDGVAYLGTTVPTDDEPPQQSACLVDAATSTLRVLPSPPGTWTRPLGWDGPHRLVCSAERGPRRVLTVCDTRHGTWQEAVLTRSVESACVARGEAAVLRSALDTPPEAVVVPLPVDPATAPSATADPQPAHPPAPATAPASQTVERSGLPPMPGTLTHSTQHLPGTTGEVAAWLARPAAGPTRGLVVLFHGGPFKSWSEWSWRWNPWPFTAVGYAVALLEPPMSLGYLPAVAGGWATWREGIAAVAARQVTRLVDTEHLAGLPLALMGGSFGGYLALQCAAALRPQLVVAHAAPLDLAQVAETSDVGWQWVREYGDPVARHDRYRANSLPEHPVAPGTRVLLSHGLHDGLVPPAETLRLHRALSRQGVRTETAFYRAEAHPLRRPRNIRAWYRWVLDACARELADESAPGPDPAAMPTTVPVPVAGGTGV
jgi:hypothetical protein